LPLALSSHENEKQDAAHFFSLGRRCSSIEFVCLSEYGITHGDERPHCRFLSLPEMVRIHSENQLALRSATEGISK